MGIKLLICDMGVFNALSKMTFVGIYFLSNYYSSMGAKLKHCRTCKMSKFNYTVFLEKMTLDVT